MIKFVFIMIFTAYLLYEEVMSVRLYDGTEYLLGIAFLLLVVLGIVILLGVAHVNECEAKQPVGF